MRNMGLGLVADQLADLKLGELLNTPPPGLNEAVAIAKVLGGKEGGNREGERPETGGDRAAEYASPPRLDESVAIAKVWEGRGGGSPWPLLTPCHSPSHLPPSLLFQVVQFVQSAEYAKFTRIVFDTVRGGGDEGSRICTQFF